MTHGWWCWWRGGWDYKLIPSGGWYLRTCRRCGKTEESLRGIFMRRCHWCSPEGGTK